MATLLTMLPPETEALSNKKKYENRSICSKIIDEQALIYVYIYTEELYNLPSF